MPVVVVAAVDAAGRPRRGTNPSSTSPTRGRRSSTGPFVPLRTRRAGRRVGVGGCAGAVDRRRRLDRAGRRAVQPPQPRFAASLIGGDDAAQQRFYDSSMRRSSATASPAGSTASSRSTSPSSACRTGRPAGCSPAAASSPATPCTRSGLAPASAITRSTAEASIGRSPTVAPDAGLEIAYGGRRCGDGASCAVAIGTGRVLGRSACRRACSADRRRRADRSDTGESTAPTRWRRAPPTHDGRRRGQPSADPADSPGCWPTTASSTDPRRPTRRSD